jgi:hypothetical protein
MAPKKGVNKAMVVETIIFTGLFSTFYLFLLMQNLAEITLFFYTTFLHKVTYCSAKVLNIQFFPPQFFNHNHQIHLFTFVFFPLLLNQWFEFYFFT